MATLRNKQKLAAASRETQENTRYGQSQNTSTRGMTVEYMTQVSEEIERRVTKKLSQEFSRTESPIVGALSKLDEFLLIPQVRTCSVAVPGTSRNNDSEKREPTGNRSLNDPYPEVEFFACRTSNLTDSDPEETSHRGPVALLYFLSIFSFQFDQIEENSSMFCLYCFLALLHWRLKCRQVMRRITHQMNHVIVTVLAVLRN